MRGVFARWAKLRMKVGGPRHTTGVRGGLQYSVVKQPWADASNTLRRERIGAYLEKYFRGQRARRRGRDPE